MSDMLQLVVRFEVGYSRSNESFISAAASSRSGKLIMLMDARIT
jgi:hypothetical protein